MTWTEGTGHPSLVSQTPATPPRGVDGRHEDNRVDTKRRRSYEVRPDLHLAERESLKKVVKVRFAPYTSAAVYFCDIGLPQAPRVVRGET